MFDSRQTSPDQDSAWCQTLLTENKYQLMMTLYFPIVFLWTDPTDSELQTLKIEIQWEDELENSSAQWLCWFSSNQSRPASAWCQTLLTE
jgi:hypothetical protein